MTASGHDEFTVIEAAVWDYYYPPQGRSPVPSTTGSHTDILVLIDGAWLPPGCETWYVVDAEFSLWVKDHRILAVPA
jgi:hypothetical protein